MPTAFGFVPDVPSGDWVVTLPHDTSIGEVIVYAVPHVSSSDLETEMLADSPAGMWPLYETAGVTALDVSGNGHHGTYSGTYALADQAFPVGAPHTRFSNPSTVEVGDADAFSSGAAGGTGEMTLEGWVYLDGFYSSNNAIVLCKAGPSNDLIEWVLSISPDGSADGYGFYQTTGALVMRCTAPAGTITTGTWHHLVYTYDRGGPTATLYVDGTSVDTDTTFPGDLDGTNQIVELGHREHVAGLSGSHWQTLGALAYLAYYDHVLDATRVAVHYAAGI